MPVPCRYRTAVASAIRAGMRSPGRRPGTKSEGGYSRQQFEAAWASFANQAPHRHRQANSGTCRGREPPHARHTFEVLPPETRPHKIDLSGRKSWCESDDPAFAAKAADIVRLYMAWP